MSNEHSLWRVTFSYDVPGDRAVNRDRTTYIVVGKDQKEAEEKSYADFCESIAHQYIHGAILTTVTQIEKRKIPKPKLTLSEDKNHFMLFPRITGDSLEFIVTERKGR